MKISLKYFFVFMTMISYLSLEGATVKSVGKGKAIIVLDRHENVAVGESYLIMNFEGQAIGKVKVKSINGSRAIVLISKSAKGKIQAGHKIQTDKDNEDDLSLSPRKKKQTEKEYNKDFTSSFSFFTEGMPFGSLGGRFSYLWGPQSALSFSLNRLSIKNDAKNVQEGFTFLLGYSLYFGSNGAFSNGFVGTAHLGYISTKLTFTDQINAEYEASLSGTVLGGNLVYHWVHQQFFCDLGLSANYYFLDSEVPVETGHIEETPLSGIALHLHLGIGLHF